MTPFAKMVSRDPSSLTPLTGGKNGAYLAKYKFGQAVLKVAEPSARGSLKTYGISTEEIPYREVAFFKLAELLGFQRVVPDTVLTEVKGRVASAQRHVISTQLKDLQPELLDEADRVAWSIKFRETMREFPKEQCDMITILDFIACSRDRHASNVGAYITHGKGEQWNLIAWDNSAAFGINFKRYYSVLHKYLHRHKLDLQPYWHAITGVTQPALREAMKDLLSPLALDHLWLRLQFIIEYPHLVPWKALSQGEERIPDYAEHFQLPFISSAQRPASSLYGLRLGAISG